MKRCLSPDGADGYVRIAATIDPSGATAGAQAVEGELAKVGEAAAEGGEIFDTSVLSNRRNVGHLLRGIIEMREGGVAAIGGLAAETHVLAEGFEAVLGPVGELIAIFSLALSVGIPLFEKYSEHADKVKEGKGGVDDYAAAWKAAGEGIAASLDKVREAQEKVLEQDREALDNIRERAAIEKTEAEQKVQAAEQDAQIAYIQALGQKGLTDDQKKTLKEKYEAQRDDIKAGGVVNTAGIEVKEKFDEYEGQEKLAADARRGLEAAQRKLDGLQADQAGAKKFLADNNLKFDKDGKAVVNDQGEDELGRRQKEVDDLKSQIEYDQKPHDTALPGGAILHENAESEADVAPVRAQLAKAQADLAQLQDVATKAKDDDGVKAAQKNVEDASKAVKDNADKLANSSQRWFDSQDAFLLAQRQQGIDRSARVVDQRNTQDDEDQKKLKTARDNQLDAQKAQLDAQLATATPEQKPALDQRKAALENQAIENKKNDELNVPVPKPVGSTPQQAFEQSVRAKASAEESLNGSRAQEAASKEEVASLRRELEQLKRQIGASTNNKGILAEEKQIEVKDAANPAKQVVDMQKLLAQAMAAGFEATAGALKDVRSQVDRVKAATDSLRSNHQS